jgi:L-threonylcarbamoyladenylate synthase
LGLLHEAAKNLFAALRAIDELCVDVILAEIFPDEGIGKAINDRLQRAGVENK